jgi:chloramphenicol-sensitive protein RarD
VGDGRGSARAGLFYGFGAYIIWGVIPLYFRAVDGVSPSELLAQRIVWSFLLLSIVLTVMRRWSDLSRPLRTRRTLLALAVSAFLLAANWLIYIHSVARREVVQASLGYFMLPLFSVFLGLIFLRERLRPPQWLAVGFAAAGIGFLMFTVDEFPWIALGVAISFGLYGLVRKVTPVDGLTGVTIETLILTPAALACLAWWRAQGTLAFGTAGGRLDLLIAASGVVTAVPLFLFGQAARSLPLSTLGFLQYIGPTAALIIAVAVFGEPLTWQKQVCFALVWIGLAILAVETVLRSRRAAPSIALRESLSGSQRQAVTCRD